MAKLLRSIVTVGAGALAYKAMTKKKILTDENVRNATLGAVAGMMGVPELEKIVKGEVSEGQGKSMKNMAIYGAIGAGIGYVLSSGKHKTAAGYAKGVYDKYFSPDEAKPEAADE